jgi:hypothetical protein
MQEVVRLRHALHMQRLPAILQAGKTRQYTYSPPTILNLSLIPFIYYPLFIPAYFRLYADNSCKTKMAFISQINQDYENSSKTIKYEDTSHNLFYLRSLAKLQQQEIS